MFPRYRRRRQRRQRSTAALLLATAVRKGRGLPWPTALAVAVVSMMLFYWLVPAYIDTRMDALQSGVAREALTHRFAHWSRRAELLGITLALVFGFFAIRNYRSTHRMSHTNARRVGLASRILARLIR